MADIEKLRQVLATRLLDGAGHAPKELRRAAFEFSRARAEPKGARGALLDKVVSRASDIRDEDLSAVRSDGLDEDQIFELVVCAAVGEATRQNETALRALAEAQGGDRAPVHP